MKILIEQVYGLTERLLTTLEKANYEAAYTHSIVTGEDSIHHTHSNKTLLNSYDQTNSDIKDAVTKRHSHSNIGVLNNLTQAVIDSTHSHSNKSLLDRLTTTGSATQFLNGQGNYVSYSETDPTVADYIKIITSTQIAGWETARSNTHTHSNQSLLDSYNQTNSAIADAVGKKHSHTNLTLLETYTQNNDLLVDAVTKRHWHTNKGILDAITNSGDGKKFLANDGTYKILSIGSGGTISPVGTDKQVIFNSLGTLTGSDKFIFDPSTGDLTILGNIYAQGNIVAYSTVAGEPGSWWDAMPVASASTLGGIKVGANLFIDANGVLSSEAGGVSSWNDLLDKPSTFPPSAHTHSFASLTSIPTTLAGYGITDAAASNHTHTFSSLTSKPTTLDGYGITDAVYSTGKTTQTIAGDVTISGNAYIQGNVVAYSSVPGISASWWDAMPIASATVLGGVKIGTNLTIDANGVLSGTSAGTYDYNALINKPDLSVYQLASTAWNTGNFNPASKQDASTAWNTGNFNPGNYYPISTLPNGGYLGLPSNPSSTNKFSAGTGDGASYSTYNIALGGWYGMGIINESSGGSYPYGTVGYLNFREGVLDMKGGFRVNGSMVYHTGNLNRSDTDFTANNINLNGSINIKNYTAINFSSIENSSSYWQIFSDNLSGSYAGANGLSIYGNGASRLAITPNGNVGIGTTSPSQKLDVNGNINASGNIVASAGLRGVEIYTSGWLRNDNSGTGLYNEANQTGIYSDAYKQMRIYNNGSLIVDNYLQANFLKFGDGSYHRYQFGTDSAFNGMYLYDSNRGQYVFNVRDSDGHIVVNRSLSSQYGSILSNDNGNGYLELATYQGSLPGYPSSYFPTLKSNGNIYISANNNYIAYINENEGIGIQRGQFVNNANGFKSTNFHGMVGDYDTNTTSSKIIWTIGDSWNTIESHYGIGYQYFSADFGHTYVVRSNGTVMIKLGGDNGSIWGAGSLTMGGNITAYSDRNLKTNLQKIDNVLPKINNINGYTYYRKDLDDNKRHLGLIAQEVEQYFPELVETDNKGIKSLNYQNYVAVLNEGIKELNKRLKKVERRIM